MKLGANVTKNGVEFYFYSESANEIAVLLFKDANDDSPTEYLVLTKSIFNYWHGVSEVAKSGWFYVLVTNGQDSAFSPNQWLLDPYAKAIHTPRKWGETTGLVAGEKILSGKDFPKCVIYDEFFNWGNVSKPEIPLKDSVIYEMQLRGFTNGGGYLDLIDKIPYIQSLGVTAIELLPIFEFNEIEFFQEGGNRQDKLNFWGYSTLSFFAPMSRFAKSDKPAAAIREFKEMVKAMHNAGIEVILDVVFTHTAEGGKNGQTWSFRGIDDKSYYMQNDAGDYMNYSGCGNTFNCNKPVARQFIVDCLVYWAEEMQVDGFRFDLASILTRMPDLSVSDHPPVIEAIEKEPALKNVKLIAEAWDAGGLYQVGSFPGARFSDWNGKFRDDVRRFWNNDSNMLGALITRMFGSQDLYNSRCPLSSVNFITSHDGFTLRDLTTYSQKHNEANGEDNRDGDNNNFSFNHGVEGETDDVEINELRTLKMKNFLATLLISRGVPMLTAGDEFGRTQKGNNNAYCQDNEISWVDWSFAEKNSEMVEFVKTLIEFRKRNSAIHASNFASKKTLKTFGPGGLAEDWSGQAIGLTIRNKITIIINNSDRDLIFKIPDGEWKLKWWSSKEIPTKTANFIEISSGSICALKSSKN